MLMGRTFENLLRGRALALSCALLLTVACSDEGGDDNPGALFDSGTSSVLPGATGGGATTGGGAVTGGGAATGGGATAGVGATTGGGVTGGGATMGGSGATMGGATMGGATMGGGFPAVDSGTLPQSDAGLATDLDAGSGPFDGSTLPDATIDDASLTADAMATDAMADSALPRQDLGKGDGKDVVIIGDSWMSNGIELIVLGTGGAIYPSLTALSKQPYRNYAKQGVMLLKYNAPFGAAIPTQWDDAVKEDSDIKTVIMTAGGNDVIQGSDSLKESCKNGGKECDDKLMEIGAKLGELWLKMASAGVQDIVHVMYSKYAGDVKKMEENNQKLQVLCNAVPAPTRCHLVATDALVGSKDGLIIDGIHPKKATNDKIAKAILDLMEKEGMRR